MGYFTKEKKGDLLSRMNSDVFEIEAVAANSLEILFKEPYIMIGYFIALFAISVKLTLFTLADHSHICHRHCPGYKKIAQGSQ